MNNVYVILIFMISFSAAAESTQEKQYLAYALEEIETLKQVIAHAESSSSQNVQGTRFNYRALRNDLVLIERGIEDYINDRHHLPRKFEPIQGDYRR